MKINLGEQYDKIVNDGVSIKALYAFSLIIEDERSFGMSEKEIEEMATKVVDLHFVEDNSLENIIDRLLNGDVIGEEEETWYY